MNVLESVSQYKDRISVELDNTLTDPALGSLNKKTGKVRDQYDLGNRLALITTDRQSAFDRVLASIPFKGQVLNMASAWWFEKTKEKEGLELLEMAQKNRTKVIEVSSHHHGGEMLIGLGGIAVILRYKLT